MLVSIVIPIYNGEKYIKKMYRSLSRQSFQDFELLYINDGSSDNSLDILVQIAKEDKRVKVYSHKNQGICASRNLGISNSHGKYIIFLDQDDDIENDLVEGYVSSIVNENTDMAVFGKIHYFISGEIINKKEYQNFSEERIYDRIKIYEYLFNLDNKKRLMTIWSCIYKKDIIEKYNICFDEHFKHGDEDGMFNIEYVLHCDSVYFSDKCYYHYYIRSGVSTITRYNNELTDDYLYFINKVCRLTSGIENEYIQTLIKLYILRFFSNIYVRFCRYHSKRKDKVKFLKRISHSDSFRYALSFSNRKYYRKFSNKYFFWDFFNYLLLQKRYNVSLLLLDLIKYLKTPNGGI